MQFYQEQSSLNSLKQNINYPIQSFDPNQMNIHCTLTSPQNITYSINQPNTFEITLQQPQSQCNTFSSNHLIDNQTIQQLSSQSQREQDLLMKLNQMTDEKENLEKDLIYLKELNDNYKMEIDKMEEIYENGGEIKDIVEKSVQLEEENMEMKKCLIHQEEALKIMEDELLVVGMIKKEREITENNMIEFNPNQRIRCRVKRHTIKTVRKILRIVG